MERPSRSAHARLLRPCGSAGSGVRQRMCCVPAAPHRPLLLLESGKHAHAAVAQVAKGLYKTSHGALHLARAAITPRHAHRHQQLVHRLRLHHTDNASPQRCFEDAHAGPAEAYEGRVVRQPVSNILTSAPRRTGRGGASGARAHRSCSAASRAASLPCPSIWRITSCNRSSRSSARAFSEFSTAAKCASFSLESKQPTTSGPSRCGKQWV